MPLKSTHPGTEQGYLYGEYLVGLSAIAKSGVHMVAADPTFANTHVSVDVRVAEETEPSWVGVTCRVTIQGAAAGFYSLDVVPATGRVVLARHDPERNCVSCVETILGGGPSWQRDESPRADVHQIEHPGPHQRHRLSTHHEL